MLRLVQGVHPLLLLVIATTLEASGDAVLRIGLYSHAGTLRVLLFLRVVGLYIATLFVVWQVINYFAFRTLPSLPTLVGGALILAGGAITTFWRPT
jgi:hypothetical protein